MTDKTPGKLARVVKESPYDKLMIGDYLLRREPIGMDLLNEECSEINAAANAQIRDVLERALDIAQTMDYPATVEEIRKIAEEYK